ncbi:MAG: hypothetical protein ACF8XB_09760 [Planctomycetota bacterium JB042]
MFLFLPHSTPRRGGLALPLGSFTARFSEPTERHPAELELSSVFTGASLVQLSGDEALDAWDQLQQVQDARAELELADDDGEEELEEGRGS